MLHREMALNPLIYWHHILHGRIWDANYKDDCGAGMATQYRRDRGKNLRLYPYCGLNVWLPIHSAKLI